MKRPNYFYVLFPANDNLRGLLNTIKYLSDESQRTEAHITVRGPYFKRLPEKDKNRFSEIIANEDLKINGVGNFFDSNQNTVFFSCANNDKLKLIWNKSSFDEFRPHITIYDGTDREFANELFFMLKSNFKSFKYNVTTLSFLLPKDPKKLPLDYLLAVRKIDDILEDILGVSKIDINFSTLSKRKRLESIDRIVERLYNSEFID